MIYSMNGYMRDRMSAHIMAVEKGVRFVGFL